MAMGELRDKRAVDDLLAAWNSPETRTNAISALARMSDLRALDAYLDGLASADATLREQCRKALTPLRDAALPLLDARASQLKPQVLAELRRVYAKHSRAESSSLFALAPQLREPADYEKHALTHSGDALRGQRIFFDEAGVACSKCHSIGGSGGTVGPDLTLIGAQFPRATLIEHVLEPSKVVREGYQQVLIETRDGEVYSGLIKAETADALTIVSSDARAQSIPKSTIVSRTMSKLSLMPEGLHQGLTLEQFTDLIAFLESRKVDPRRAGDQSVSPAKQ